MKYSARLVKMLKQRENIDHFESIVGRVVSAPPQLKISIFEGKVILQPDQLYMNDRLFDDYTREYKLEGTIDSIQINATSKNILTGPGPHQHEHGTIEGKGKYKAKGTIVNTCTLIEGDIVKLTPTQNGQLWFVDYKVRKLGGKK